MKQVALVRDVTVCLSLLVVATSVAQAKTNCNGEISGTHDDVIVTGLGCTLDGATVRGSVFVTSGRTLTATGGTEVRGSIQADSAGDIHLVDAIVLGDVTLKNSSDDVTIEADVSTGKLLVENSGAVTVRGSVAAIFSTRSAGVSLTGARVFPGGVIMVLSSGSLEICGSEIGINSDTMTDGSGGVTVIESGDEFTAVDVLAVAAGSCAASQIEGSVIVAKGTGDVTFVGATLQSDLNVIEQAGDVFVQQTSLSDVKVEKLLDPGEIGAGNVTLDGVTTDSDTTIVDITGNATIEASMIVGDVQIKSVGGMNIGSSTLGSSTLGGDVEIKSAGNVTLDDVTSTSDTSIVDNADVEVDMSELSGDLKITSNDGVTVTANDFFLEDISISKNSGPVIVDGNINLSLSIIENNDVTVTNNIFTDAEVSKNTGGVAITGNTGEKLNCSDNDPAPSGVGTNTITELADGQCVGF